MIGKIIAGSPALSSPGHGVDPMHGKPPPLKLSRNPSPGSSGWESRGGQPDLRRTCGILTSSHPPHRILYYLQKCQHSHTCSPPFLPLPPDPPPSSSFKIPLGTLLGYVDMLLLILWRRPDTWNLADQLRPHRRRRTTILRSA